MKQTTEKTELETIIELWNKNEITSCTMNFSCGGDSMNDYNFECYSKKSKNKTKLLENKDTQEIIGFLEEEVFKKIDFYECSDGHYIGESGTVEITLEGDEFDYYKDATSEYNENRDETMKFELSEEEVNFIKDYITRIDGEEGGSFDVTYSKDFIMTEEQDTLLDNLRERLDDESCDYSFNDDSGECLDFYRWTMDSGDLNEEEKTIDVLVEKTFVIYQPSEN